MPVRKLPERQTTSDRIRDLAAQGKSRSEIATELGKRYQHVWNVLEGDRTRTGSTPAAAPPPATQDGDEKSGRTEQVGAVLRMRLGEDGTIELPSAMLAAFGFKPGSLVIGRLEGERLMILSREANLREIQASVRRYVPEGVSLVDELIAERREAAARGD